MSAVLWQPPATRRPMTVTESILSVQGFAKTFHIGLRRKPFVAAKQISLEVQRGEIFGFLGPNGSGKTTTIKALLGLIRADAGTLSVLGHPPSSQAWRARVGYMPEHPNFYEFLSGLEMVTWFGRLSGMVRHQAEAEAKRLLARVGLEYAMQRRIRSYSKGMLQRAGLAACLVGSPQLLILDEPMTGLDPIGRREVRELLLELKSEGKTVFYSTHILPDVEMTCDRVSIVSRGQTLRDGRLSDILTETTKGGTVVMAGVAEAEVARLQQQHPGANIRDGALHVELSSIEAARDLTAAMLSLGASLVRFEPHRDDLETIFMRALGDASKDRLE